MKTWVNAQTHLIEYGERSVCSGVKLDFARYNFLIRVALNDSHADSQPKTLSSVCVKSLDITLKSIDHSNHAGTESNSQTVIK